MLIGEWCSSASIAAAQVANDAKVPMLVQISTADGIAKNAGAVCVSSDHAEFGDSGARGEAAARKVHVQDRRDSGREQRLRPELSRQHAPIAGARERAGWCSTSPRIVRMRTGTIITRIKGLEPDLVVVSISADQAATFVKQYAESNLKTPLFSDYTPPPLHLREAGRAAGRPDRPRPRHIFRRQSRRDGAPEGVRRRLRAAGRARVGERRPAVHWDIVTYDAVMIAADALRRGGARTADFLTVARVDESRRRARPLRIRRRPPDQTRGVRLSVRSHDAGRRTRGREVMNADSNWHQRPDSRR